MAGRTGHGCTDQEATRHMYDEFARSGIDRRHVLADPPDTVEETAREVWRRARGGVLRYP